VSFRRLLYFGNTQTGKYLLSSSYHPPQTAEGHVMKNAAAGIAAVLALIGTPALAADMGLPAKAPLAPPPVPMVNWTGCYVEGGGGYGLWNIDHFMEFTSSLTPDTTTSTSGGRGWLGTAGGGCDYQFSPAGGWGNWVVGVFADYDFMDLQENLMIPFATSSGEAKESSAWGVGGRIGYLVTPNVLSYFNGGYTQTRFDQINFISSFSRFTPTAVIGAHTYNGWFLGGGTEISLSGFFGLPLPSGLFLRSEYRYSSYNGADLPILSPAGAPTIFSEHMRPYVQTITTALVYRFNWVGR
jgi:outer membrane immunogenic protein